jgi:hypothetical protein
MSRDVEGCQVEDEPDPATGELADLADRITRRLEAGEPVNGGDLGHNSACAGQIRQLLPTLRTMVAFGDQIARDEGSRTRSQMKYKEKFSSLLDTNRELEEVGP